MTDIQAIPRYVRPSGGDSGHSRYEPAARRAAAIRQETVWTIEAWDEIAAPGAVYSDVTRSDVAWPAFAGFCSEGDVSIIGRGARMTRAVRQRMISLAASRAGQRQAG